MGKIRVNSGFSFLSVFTALNRLENIYKFSYAPLQIGRKKRFIDRDNIGWAFAPPPRYDYVCGGTSIVLNCSILQKLLFSGLRSGSTGFCENKSFVRAVVPAVNYRNSRTRGIPEPTTFECEYKAFGQPAERPEVANMQSNAYLHCQSNLHYVEWVSLSG
jgi:hypothetical protein